MDSLRPFRTLPFKINFPNYECIMHGREREEGRRKRERWADRLHGEGGREGEVRETYRRLVYERLTAGISGNRRVHTRTHTRTHAHTNSKQQTHTHTQIHTEILLNTHARTHAHSHIHTREDLEVARPTLPGSRAGVVLVAGTLGSRSSPRAWAAARATRAGRC